jgi:hypothetical protein
MRHLLLTLLLLPTVLKGQILVDSIPYPGMLNLNFWGIHVTPDTIFLGADGPGHIYFSTHNGTILGNQPTGFTYNHGLIKRSNSYLIAKDFTTQGGRIHEVDLQGQLLQEWTVPQGILGVSGGIGDLEEAGDGAIWFTVYHQQSETYPFTYAYKWEPGSPVFLDTVPLLGKQPYGIALKGDTLFYVIDNIHGDPERIYAYDLTSQEDLFWFELPDTQIDNDQRPFGLHWDGNFLYLVANRQGGSAFAHQTIFIYAIDSPTGISHTAAGTAAHLFPNPAQEAITIELQEVPTPNTWARIFDGRGQLIREAPLTDKLHRLPCADLPSGNYVVNINRNGYTIASQRISIIR